MFANVRVGKSGNPLNRPALRWFLVVLGLLAVAAVAFLLVASMKESDSVSKKSVSADGTIEPMVPTEEEMRKRLDFLAAEDAKNLVPKLSQEEMLKRLEALEKK